MLGIVSAIAAGLCAALASVTAKTALEEDVIQSYCAVAGHYITVVEPSELCSHVLLYLRILVFLSMFLWNTLMWMFFVKALHYCSSSLQATVVNTATNFTCSALFGYILFGESVTLSWWFGISLVVMGLLLIHRGSSLPTDHSKQE